jgi:hypothetical protein
MTEQVFIWFNFSIPPATTILGWLVRPFLTGIYVLAIRAWYPFDQHENFNFMILHFYQMFGFVLSASTSVVTDMTAVSLLLQAKGQLEKLGVMLSRVRSCDVKNETFH